MDDTLNCQHSRENISIKIFYICSSLGLTSFASAEGKGVTGSWWIAELESWTQWSGNEREGSEMGKKIHSTWYRQSKFNGTCSLKHKLELASAHGVCSTFKTFSIPYYYDDFTIISVVEQRSKRKQVLYPSVSSSLAAKYINF